MTVAYEYAPRGLATATANTTTTTTGMALKDRFEVLKDIGDGSFGSVALARVRGAGSSVARRGTMVAIKTMKKSYESFAPCLELREVVFLRTLPVHPHLVPALDIFLDPFSRKLHIAMEYMDGNLYQLMKARDHKCMDGASVKSILFQIMQGLEHIHDHHFFHRDIKPENILVSATAQPEGSFRRYSQMGVPSLLQLYTVKIADFGLARETQSKLPYTTYVSTRWYRAPEVLLRAGEYSAPVDIWAIGAMAVEIATLKPLFPGGNEVDQVWRVCEIMGSPGNWYSKAGSRVGGGDWKEGTRLAGKLGFSFPKMAPHAMDTILQAPQWPSAFSQFVTWCLMWDPKQRPTSAQALAHEYFSDAVDPLRPKSSSATRILSRKQSDLNPRIKETVESTQSKPSWFRKSLIGRTGNDITNSNTQPSGKENIAPRPAVVHASTMNEVPVAKTRPTPGKRATWANGTSTGAPMPILPTIRPISPLSDTSTAQASNRTASYSRSAVSDDKMSKKLGRQLSGASHSHYDTEMHRQQAERALNGNGASGMVSPLSGQKESFFSHLRKRARRFSGRHQTPMSPNADDIEAQAGCGPWHSNRSSMLVDATQVSTPGHKVDTYEALDKALRAVQDNLESHSQITALPGTHAQLSPTSGLKRVHSLHGQQTRSVDNLIGATRSGAPISSRTRRAHAHGNRRYETPDEEDELLNEAMSNSHEDMKQVDNNGHEFSKSRQYLGDGASVSHHTLSHASSVIGLTNPYPTPSPSANGSAMMFDQQQQQNKSIQHKVSGAENRKWPTPPYEENEWAASAAASIWAVGNRF